MNGPNYHSHPSPNVDNTLRQKFYSVITNSTRIMYFHLLEHIPCRQVKQQNVQNQYGHFQTVASLTHPLVYVFCIRSAL